MNISSSSSVTQVSAASSSQGNAPGALSQARRFKPVSGKSGRKPSKAAAIKAGSSLSAPGSSLSAASKPNTGDNTSHYHQSGSSGPPSSRTEPSLNAPGPQLDTSGTHIPRHEPSSTASASSRLHSLSRPQGTRIRMPPTRRPSTDQHESHSSSTGGAPAEQSNSDPLSFTIGDIEGYFPTENDSNNGGDTNATTNQTTEDAPKKRTLKDFCMDDENELVSSRFRKIHNEARKKRKTTEKSASASSEKNDAANTENEATQEGDDNPIGPQVQLVNGRIVVSQESLTAPTTHDSRSVDDFEEIDEHVGRRITAKSFKAHGKSQRWSKEDTSAFYEALRICGTNFSMIASLFPNRTRRQVKAKYLREERQHPLLVDAALKSSVKMTTENYDYALEHGIHSMVGGK